MLTIFNFSNCIFNLRTLDMIKTFDYIIFAYYKKTYLALLSVLILTEDCFVRESSIFGWEALLWSFSIEFTGKVTKLIDMGPEKNSLIVCHFRYLECLYL